MSMINWIGTLFTLYIYKIFAASYALLFYLKADRKHCNLYKKEIGNPDSRLFLFFQ